MGRRNPHRSHAGGRRRFFLRMMLEHPEYGEFDPSVFPPPLITPPPSPVEESDAPGSEKASPQENSNTPTPGKKTPEVPPPLKPRKLVSRATSTFIPARVLTRPVPLSVGARRPSLTKKEAAPPYTQRQPRILGSVYPNFEVQKTPQGYIVTMGV